MPMGLKCQSAWIHSYALELAALVHELAYPVAYLASMTEEFLLAFGYSINSESQLDVICKHIPHADERLREF